MDVIQAFFSHTQKAFEYSGLTLDDQTKYAITRPFSNNESEMGRIGENIDTLSELFLKYFFNLVRSKNPFCDSSLFTQRFGRSPEENYGIASGPFINLAKTYWTLKLLLDEADLLVLQEDGEYTRFSEESDTTGYTNILIESWCKVERMVGCLFFPMPGPIKQPRWLRKYAQKRFLKSAAPDLNTKEFFRTNPFV